MPHPSTARPLPPGVGYADYDGRFVPADSVILIPAGTYGAGTTVGTMFESGHRRIARATLAVTARAGTNPTLDVAVQTSPDGYSWRTLAGPGTAPQTFRQVANVVNMSAVTAAGTTPPTLTLGGTATRPIDLRVRCTVLGARGTFRVQFSGDAGVTYGPEVIPPDDATTPAVVDAEGPTGLTYTFADAAAALDNVWTATSTGLQRVSLAGVDRFVRAVALVGGTSTPTFTFALAGELV